MIRFTLIGPLRTGSSLLSRCIDDHPDLICLCESEIGRALFGEYYLKLHFLRMRKHGLHPVEIMELLDRKRQNSVSDYELWHGLAVKVFGEKYEKANVGGFGDKSPDFYRLPSLADHIAGNHRLIYTIRDPRAIYRSIWADRTSEVEKQRRWEAFRANFSFWKGSLDQENILVLKFEDLISEPAASMSTVFRHIGVPRSNAFQEAFPRKCPERFLWKGATEAADDGVQFLPSKNELWREELCEETVQKIQSDPETTLALETFGYSLV